MKSIPSRLTDLLNQGFQKIETDYLHMMHGLSQVLSEFGKDEFSRILPEIGDPEKVAELPIHDQNQAVAILSLASQLLNVVEQNATGEFRWSVASQVGPEWVSGSVAEVIASLRHTGADWTDIVSSWRELNLQLVFTAHPTESRRASLIDQLRQLFIDLNAPAHQVGQGREFILKNLEMLLGTGEFIQTKPSVASEREFITRIIRSSLPDSIALLVRDVTAAFSALGCPKSLIPKIADYPNIRFRSWVASDRDGHPYVTAQETLETILRNRREAMGIIREAIADLSQSLSLSRFHVAVPSRLFDQIGDPNAEEPWRVACNQLLGRLDEISKASLQEELSIISETLRESGAERLAWDVDIVLFKVKLFGFHLVSQDIRQNSATYHAAVEWILNESGLGHLEYSKMTDAQRCRFIQKELKSSRRFLPPDYPLVGPAKDAIESLRVAATAIRDLGHESMGSLIVSMTRQTSDLLQVLLVAREAGLLDYFHGNPVCLMPIVPLIETAEDHQNALGILKGFINDRIVSETIRYHHRREGQGEYPGVRVMCGHSDGGKDAGIVDNFLIMLESRSRISQFLEKNHLKPIFFEGIGGTLIRGAAPIKYLIANSLPASKVGGFEYTEQGQIIAQNHLVPFMSAWTVENGLAALLHHEFSQKSVPIPKWFSDGTRIASQAYRELVNTAGFAQFFTHVTPLDLLEFARMGSRPTRRTGADTLADLRAIPFVLCQSQSRFNFTAWYGVGTMLETMRRHQPSAYQKLCTSLKKYPQVEFVLTNVEMAIKSASTAWMVEYSRLEGNESLRASVMTKILDEYQLTVAMLEAVFGQSFEIRRPRLARTIETRRPILDTLHRCQLQAIRGWRSATTGSEEADNWLRMALMTVNAISNALRGTG